MYHFTSYPSCYAGHSYIYVYKKAAINIATQSLDVTQWLHSSVVRSLSCHQEVVRAQRSGARPDNRDIERRRCDLRRKRDLAVARLGAW